MGDYLLHCIENDRRANRMGDMFAGQMRFENVFGGTVGYRHITIAVQKQERIGQRIGHGRKQSERFARVRIFLSRRWSVGVAGERSNHAVGAGEGLRAINISLSYSWF
jgi:hypothetical protein